MKVVVNAAKPVGAYTDPTAWQNSTLRYAPPVDFPVFLASRVGKAKIMRTWITLDEYWDYRTGITYPDYEIGKMRYPVEQLHYPYDMALLVPAPSGTRFEDYLVTHSQNAQELLLNVRRYEREVSDGVITYDQYEDVFYRAVEYCKALAPNIRYVECCNEVDIKTFGKLTAQEYVNIYLRAHKAITALNEKYQYPIPLELGGFAEAHPLQNWKLMEEVMELLKESPIGADPMSFYSYHMYNAPENRSLGLGERPELAELTGVEKLKMIVRQHEQLLARLELPARPVFLNELGRARATGVDEDCIYNAAGMITYLIAFANGEYGEAYPFPWCTFHNPKLQISYTQYVLREDGTYAATPNGIAVEMLHGMSGDRLALEMTNPTGPDSQYAAIATRDGDQIQILAANTSCEAYVCFVEVADLPEGTYQVEIYSCNCIRNNMVCNPAESGALTKTGTVTCTTEGGVLRFREPMDRDCFSLFRIRPV